MGSSCFAPTRIPRCRPADVRSLAGLRALRLATYRYRDNPGRQRLGFVIDDGTGRLAVDESRDQIDLYAYMSWAVGALQSQMKRIDAQDREIASLKRSLQAGRVSK